MTTSKAPRVSLAAVVVGLVIGLALGSSVAFWLALSTWRHFQQTFQPMPESSPSSRGVPASSQSSQGDSPLTPNNEKYDKNDEIPHKRKAPDQRKVTKRKKAQAKGKKMRQAPPNSSVVPVFQHHGKKSVHRWTAPAQPNTQWQPSSSARPTTAKHSFRYTESKGVNDLVPWLDKNDAEKRLVSLTFERLWYDHNTNTPKPWLAVKWRSLDDGKRLRIHLRKNVRWHDGKALTAKDLHISIVLSQRLQFTLRQKQMNHVFHLAKIVDSHEVEVSFNRAVKQPWRILNVWLLPAHKLSTKIGHHARNPFFQNPIGTGPYKYHSKRGRSITLKRYSGYWRKTNSSFSTIVMRTIPDPHIALEVLRYGGVDVMMDYPVAHLPTPSHQRTFFFASYRHSRWWSIVCNIRNPILQKPSLRRALFSLMGQRLPQVSQAGTEQLLTGPFAPHSPLAAASNALRKTNKDEALRDLRQEGWVYKENTSEHNGQLRHKQGKPFRLNLLLSLQHHKLTPVLKQLQQDWRENGLDIRIRWASPSRFRQVTRYLRNFDLALMEWDLPDRYTFGQLAKVFSLPKKLNYGAYHNNEVFLRLKQAALSDDFTQALRHFEHALRHLEKDWPHLWLWYLPGQMAISTKLGGVRVDPDMPLRHILQWFKLP